MLRVAGAAVCGCLIASAVVLSLGQTQGQNQTPAGQAQGQGQGQAATPARGRGRGPSPEALAAAGTRPPSVTKAEYEKWKTDLSNWGRWGKDDQLGAINLITAATRKQAASLVKEGVTVSLAHDEDTVRAIDNPSPLVQTMVWTGANTPGPFLMDTYAWTSDPAASYHGFFHTHLDALCHMFY